MPRPGETKFTPPELERRLLSALAGGETTRNRLRLAVKSDMRVAEFEPLVGGLIARGLVTCEARWTRVEIMPGMFTQRRVIYYSLVNPSGSM